MRIDPNSDRTLCTDNHVWRGATALYDHCYRPIKAVFDEAPHPWLIVMPTIEKSRSRRNNDETTPCRCAFEVNELGHRNTAEWIRGDSPQSGRAMRDQRTARHRVGGLLTGVEVAQRRDRRLKEVASYRPSTNVVGDEPNSTGGNRLAICRVEGTSLNASEPDVEWL